jgi:hypothetical protein
VVVKTNFSLGDIIQNKDANERIVKWAIDLCPYSLEFQSHTTIKSQALVNFIVEWTDLSAPPSQGLIDYWQMYFDGSLKIDGAGADMLFISPNNDKLRYVLRLHFPASNNTTEYEACLHDM